ncbi:MAG TPA: DUF3048 domain-containing protein [Clostridiales bacterium]|nr:DUF3048 domain-containing protein [Clostridiales bacterium]
MRKLKTIMIIFLITFIFIGCKKRINEDKTIEKEDKLIITETPTPSPTPIEEIENHDGEIRSFLTGEWLAIEKAYNRPYAIQFSNYKTVRNQWGISEADILYEALVEGGITRIVGIGQNFQADRIGSVRSARHYYVSFINLYDAIYIHYGKTKYATKKISELGINNIDGTTGIGDTVFYRVSDLKAPHNAFTSISKIEEGIKKKGFNKELAEDYKGQYLFYNNDTDIKGVQAVNKITLKHFNYNKPNFEYKSEDRMFYRFQFGEPHKDSNTNEQLKFKNIIVQFVKEWNIDKNGYQTMDIESAKGAGYYITNGQLVNITWEMNENNKFICYYNDKGEVLNLNPGKTFIVIHPDNKISDVIIE